MTPEMLDRARANAAKAGYKNVEFRLGEIENLPVADDSVDVVISNCVINLSPDKARVFREAFAGAEARRPADGVRHRPACRPLPEAVRRSVEAYVGCIAGAMLQDDYLAAIRGSGFTGVEVLAETGYQVGSSNPDETETTLLTDPALSREEVCSAAEAVVSVKIGALKP